jgi:urease accessory protein
MPGSTMLMLQPMLSFNDDDTLQARALPLPVEVRKRSRQRWNLGDGREVAWILEPGSMLHAGERLQADDGSVFEVTAAPEDVLRISADTPRALARAAYHLGNRHASIEVGEDYLAIEPDPVLRDMLQQLGVHVIAVQAPFQPETGAYGGGHKHSHDGTFTEDYALAQSVFVRHA